MTGKPRFLLIAGGVLFALGLVTMIPAVGSALAGLGGGIHAANLAYLGQSVASVEHEAVLLGESLALLEILGSTDLGVNVVVSANVNVGAALAALIGAVEDGLEVALAALALLALWEAVLAAAFALSGPLLGAALLVTGLALAATAMASLRSVRHVLRHAAEVTTLAFLLAHIALPYAVNVSGLLTSRLVTPGADHSGPAELHRELTSDGGQSDPTSHWSSGKTVRAALEATAQRSSAKTGAIQDSWIDRLTHLVMMGVVFPILVIGALWAISARGIGLAFRELDRLWSELVSTPEKAAPS